LAYAVAPGLMKRLMARMLSTPEQGLRVAGVSTLAIGVILVAVLR
ncbi:MAG TPA: DUF2065 domain-containing protein, partial [Alphaproteobacteria bacterium]|nr:DUF2065 domain-containing protein [Alphaproteobacteria bacterium]